MRTYEVIQQGNFWYFPETGNKYTIDNKNKGYGHWLGWDENGNLTYFMPKEKAIEREKSNTNCFYCTDCTNSKDCLRSVNLSNCEDCRDSSNCVASTKLRNCYKCDESKNLKNSTFCNESENLINCRRVENSKNCKNSIGLKRCEQCEECINLKNCTQCYNVTHSEGCHELGYIEDYRGNLPK
jgi:hypothetical protein